MKRVLALLAAAAAVALGAVAAPAVSLEPYRPEPVDFSMAAERVLGSPAPGAGVVSEPMRAPRRFNLVGLRWSAGHGQEEPGHRDDEAHGGGHAGGPAIAMRTRADGGEWSRWTAVEALDEDGPDPGTDEGATGGMANPVWAGEADWVQYRSSEPLAGARLSFVNTAGTATAAERLRTRLRGAVSTAVASVAAAVGSPLARAQEPQPRIVARADWGAQDCPPRRSPSYGEVRAAYIHHTVNINSYSRAEAPQVVLGICRYHRNSNGWNDIGYNFLVDRFGTIYEGRAGGIEAAVTGAQAEGFNAQTTGIANIGTFTSVPQSRAALESMAALLRWKLPLHGVPTAGTTVLRSAGGSTNRYPAGSTVRVRRIIGHRDTNATACPGDSLYAQLAELRAMAAGARPFGVATALSLETTVRRGLLAFGREAPLSGVLTTADGAPLAGQPVAVQALVDGRWRTSSTPITGADGSFQATVKPRLNRDVRVRFAGADELRSSVSPMLGLRVRPVVRLRVGAAAAEPGQRVALRGRVRPRTRVHQVLRVQRGGRFRMAGVTALRPGAKGFYRSSFVPSTAGTYRVYVIAKATATRARGASPRIDVAVGVSSARRGRSARRP